MRSPSRIWMQAALISALSFCWLGWHVSRTEILFADGLRYIYQAQTFDRGEWADGVHKGVDHPIYPLAVALTHRLLRTGDNPPGWQIAAQLASAMAGALLVTPLILLSRELFGKSSAIPGCVLVFLVPIPAHVLADALSEGTFLFFWLWGFYASLRFLRAGDLRWLSLALGLGGLAYLSRPEGLLLFLALTLTLGLSLFVPAARLSVRCWWLSVATILLVPTLLIGPYVVAKGGVGTKPAIARLLGSSGPSRHDAVERERPLAADLPTSKIYQMAITAAITAVCGAVTFPLLPFSLIGIAAAIRRTRRERLRAWLYVGVILVTSMMAFTRLYATGGYCTPRHTLAISILLIAAAVAGIRTSIALLVKWGRFAAIRKRTKLASFVMTLGLVATNAPALLTPVNSGAGAYRTAGLWVGKNVALDGRIVDVTGWAQYYGERPGYTFANLIEAPSDPSARWVIVRDAHLTGPWSYCEQLRSLVSGAKLVARFPLNRRMGQARVSIYERPVALATENSPHSCH